MIEDDRARVRTTHRRNERHNEHLASYRRHGAGEGGVIGEGLESEAAGPSLRIHVDGWVGGNPFGVLTVCPGAVIFSPGPISRFTLRLAGQVVHTDAEIVAVQNPLNLGGFRIVLHPDTPGALVMSPLLARDVNLAYANIRVYPWQGSRLLKALRGAGIHVDMNRRWTSFLLWKRWEELPR